MSDCCASVGTGWTCVAPWATDLTVIRTLNGAATTDLTVSSCISHTVGFGTVFCSVIPPVHVTSGITEFR